MSRSRNPAAFEQAQRALQAGDLPKAEALLRTLARQQPRFAAAWHLLGVIAARAARHSEAVECLQRGSALEPRDAEILAHLAEALRQAADLPRALQAAERAAGLAPRSAAVHNNLGLVLRDMERFDEAQDAFRRASALDPAYARAHFNLGALLCQRKRFTEAEPELREALRLQPGYAQALAGLGLARLEQDDLDEAESLLGQALRLRPDDATTLANLGALLLRRGELEPAVRQFRQALAHRPGLPEAVVGQASALERLGELHAAVDLLAAELQRRPAWIEGLRRLSSLYGRLDRHAEAARASERILELTPGAFEPSADLLHQRAMLCDWADRERLLESVRAGFAAYLEEEDARPPNLSSVHAAGVPPAELCRLVRKSAARLGRRASPMRHRLGLVPVAPDGVRPPRLKIGYFSADLRNHAVGHLTCSMFERHDRERFEVHVYSFGKDDGSVYRRRIAAGADHFVDVERLDDPQTARRIHADGIHILVDLMGYTLHARVEVLALRPAPLQASWLGYPGTLGGEIADYLIIDPHLAPAGSEAEFAEALAVLPHTYMPSDDTMAAVLAELPPPRRAEEGLPEQGVVYCCFNNTYKIEPVMFAVWMEVLRAVPGSVLWCRSDSPQVEANLRREAAARGVAPGRLVYARYAGDKAHHLRRLGLADLFFDTLHYNAHTTANDALWAGVPVLTVEGSGFPGRVGAGLARAAGLPEMVMPTLEAFREETIRLGRDARARGELRARLLAGRSHAPLFDTTRFVRDLESIYDRMWQHHSRGERPHRIDL